MSLITPEIEERMVLVAQRLRMMLVALRQVAIHEGHPLLGQRTAQAITALADLGRAMGVVRIHAEGEEGERAGETLYRLVTA
jgi:hypothetical protein